MIVKLEKLVDLAIAYYERELGETRVGEPTDRIPAPVGRPRKKKEAAEVKEVDPSMFPAEPAKNTREPSPEEHAEVGRRCQEATGHFIRRYLKSTPSGYDRAKKIMAEECGRPITKLEDLTYDERLKLIARFEKELA